MRVSFFVALATLLLLPSFAAAQSQAISCRLLDVQGQPVEGLIWINGKGPAASSAQGRFSVAVDRSLATAPIYLQVADRIVLSPYSGEPGRFFPSRAHGMELRVVVAKRGDESLLKDSSLMGRLVEDLLFRLVAPSEGADLQASFGRSLDTLLQLRAAEWGLPKEKLSEGIVAWKAEAKQTYDKALLAFLDRDFVDATRLVLQSLADDPQQRREERQLTLVAASFYSGTGREALRELQQAGEINEQDPEWLANAAAIVERHGRLSEARELLEQAVALQERIWGEGHFRLAAAILNLERLLRRIADQSNDPAAARQADRLRKRALDLLDPERVQPISLPSFDGTLRSNFGRQWMQDLPLRGVRSFDLLALLAPGVFRVPMASGQGPAIGIGVGSAGQFSANGLRGRSNNFTLDGSDNNDEEVGVRRQGFAAVVPQSIESVQELQVMTGLFPAQFGRNSSSMVNIISQAGGSEFHGSLYGLFGHDSLNARNFFDLGFSDEVNQGDLSGGAFSGDEFRRTLYGGVLGGPIIPKELFFFVSAEQQRARGRDLRHFVVPTESQRGLQVRAGDPDGFVPIGELEDYFRDNGILGHSSLAGQAVYSLYPLPNNPAGPFAANTYSQAVASKADGTIFSGRIDWHPERFPRLPAAWSTRLTVRSNFSDDQSLLPFTGDAIDSSLATDTRTQNYSLYLNSTKAGFGNMLRSSYGRINLQFPPEKGSPLLFGSSPDVADLPSRVFPSNVSGFNLIRPEAPISTPFGDFGPFGATGPIGQLWIAPFSPIGIDVFHFPQGRADNTFQVSDFVTWAAGGHILKAGFDIRRTQLNSFADRNYRPLVLFGHGLVGECLGPLDPGSGRPPHPPCPFGTASGFLPATDLASLGAPGAIYQTLSTVPQADSRLGLRFTQYDFMIQDDWRIKAGFSLNLGLRYEWHTVPQDASNRIEDTFNFDFASFSRLNPQDPFSREIELANQAFDTTTALRQVFLDGRQQVFDEDRNNLAPRIGFAWDLGGRGKAVLRGGYGISFDTNLGALASESRNAFPNFAPVNLDPNFFPPSGVFLHALTFLNYLPLDSPLVQPGTLNLFNLPAGAFATGLGALFPACRPDVQQTFPPPLGGGFSAQPCQEGGFDFSGNGLAFNLPQRRLKTAHAQHIALSLEQRLARQWRVSVRYVGTRGLNLLRPTTPNAGLLAIPLLTLTQRATVSSLDVFSRTPSFPPQSGQRPIRGLGAFSAFDNSASSSYHSFQLQVEGSHKAFSFRGHWTYSHAIDEVSDPYPGRGFFALPQDSTQLRLERGSANFDVRHRVRWVFGWGIPQPFQGAFWKGWRLVALGEFQTGQPFTVNTSLDRNFDGNLTDRLDTLDGLTIRSHDPRPIRINEDFAPLQLDADNPSIGRVGRNTFRMDGIALVDLAFSRLFPLGLGIKGSEANLEIRAEVFNLFNRTHFGIPVRILESPGFGQTFDTQADSRSVRFLVRLVF